jgi:hypothetical protein
MFHVNMCYTNIGDTRVDVRCCMANRNITLSLPEETLQEVKIIAVKQGTSVSSLLTGMLEELVGRETGYRQAEQEFMALAEVGFDLGTGGQSTWSRDELHER